jgi:fatty acid desaturase
MAAESPASEAPPAGLWREAQGAVPNSLALGYAVAGYAAGFVLMAADALWLNAAGVLLTAHAMVIAAYLIHEAAHYTLFARPAHNLLAGEAMSWIAGSAYASFERIRHLHLRHHRDRADVTCFDYKAFLERRPVLARLVYALEWAHVPAVETVMHLQVIVRPFAEAGQRKHRPRAAIVLAIRLALLALLALLSLKPLLL